MHLLAFTPIDVDAAELQRRQDRYDHLSPAGITVELRNIGPDAPSALDTELDVRRSEQVLSQAFRSLLDTHADGFLPDCVLDPCAEEADSFARPLYGLTRLTASFYASQGHRIGALARNDAIAAELDRRLGFYGIVAEATEVLETRLEHSRFGRVEHDRQRRRRRQSARQRGHVRGTEDQVGGVGRTGQGGGRHRCLRRPAGTVGAGRNIRRPHRHCRHVVPGMRISRRRGRSR